MCIWGESSNPIVANCLFKNNIADGGGGMFNYDSSHPFVIHCSFQQNTAVDGGGMHNYFGSIPVVVNCMFNGNDAESGGGMNNDESNSTVINCEFVGNTAQDGGGICNSDGSHPSVINCTFSGNAALNGGGICSWGTSHPTITNSILWWNDPTDLFGSPGSVSYSCYDNGFSGQGNISIDPLFMRMPDPGPDGLWGTADDDYGDLQLQSGSPCIDAADNTAVPPDVADLDGDGDTTERTPLDLVGVPRFVDDPATIDTGVADPPDYLDIVDMGAQEFQICPADLTGDNLVNVNDIFAVLGLWGECSDPCPPYCAGDLTEDCTVNIDDIFAILGMWGPCE